MRDRVPGRIIWVADRGSSSAENRLTCRTEPGATLSGRRSAPNPARQGGAVPAAPLPADRREPAGQGSPDRRHRSVRDLPQPRHRHPRRRHLGPGAVKLEETITRSGALTATKRAELRGKISMMPGPNRLLGVPQRPAAHRQDQDQGRGQPGRQGTCCAARTPAIRRGHRPRLQANARGRTRLAGHEASPGPAPGLPPARITRPRPGSAVLARATAHRIAENAAGQAWPAMRREPRPHLPGHLHRPGRSASTRPRAKPGWTTTRSAAGGPGTPTSPCPCSPWPGSPPAARRP
jgi:hypothetical protein